MIPKSQLAEAPAQSMFTPVSRDWLAEARSFTVGLVATAALVFVGMTLVAFALLAAAVAAPVLAVLAFVGLARLDRSRATAARRRRVSPANPSCPWYLPGRSSPGVPGR
jgi:hypothetical protein